MKLIIARDGTIRGLWDDAVDWPTLGRISIRRASHVEFCPQRQRWYVQSGHPRSGGDACCNGCSAARSARFCTGRRHDRGPWLGSESISRRAGRVGRGGRAVTRSCRPDDAKVREIRSRRFCAPLTRSGYPRYMLGRLRAPGARYASSVAVLESHLDTPGLALPPHAPLSPIGRNQHGHPAVHNPECD